MIAPSLVVVAAGLGVPSSTRLLADRLAAASVEQWRARGVEPEVTVIELRDHARDLADTMVTGFAPAALQQAIDTVGAADALIVVSPVFTASYSGLFKMFFDVLDPTALQDKPVLLGATAGSVRHSLVVEHAMRPLFSYLRAVVVPTAVFAATEDFGGDAGAALTARIDRAAAQLTALVDPGTPVVAATAPGDGSAAAGHDGSAASAGEPEVPAFADLLATVASGGSVPRLRW